MQFAALTKRQKNILVGGGVIVGFVLAAQLSRISRLEADVRHLSKAVEYTNQTLGVLINRP